MPSGSCERISELPSRQADLLGSERRGVLSTIGEEDFPHSVPVVFVVVADDIVSPIDDKPKGSGELARVRNILARPVATLLVDHWNEDWRRLGWVMVRAIARVEQRNVAESALRSRYPQYNNEVTPGQRSIVLTPQRISWWSWE